MKKLTKKNITALLTQIQDEGDWIANSIATEAIEKFGLEKEHEKLQKRLTKKNKGIN